MDNGISSILDVLKGEKILSKDAKVTRILPSYHNRTYLIKDNSKKYIVKVSKNILQEPFGIKNEFLSLKFLEKMGMKFVPKAIYFHEKEPKFEVLEFVGEKIKRFKKKDIILLAKEITKIESLNTKEFEKFLKKNNQKIVITDPKTSFEIFGINRFRESIGKMPKTWEEFLKEELNEIKSILEEIPGKELHISHGDYSFPNFRRGKDKIFLVDWEFCRLSKEDDVHYLLIHGGLSFWQKVLFLKEYFKNFKNRDKIKKMIILKARITLLNDIIWAAWMYSKANNIFYRRIYQERVRKYKKRLKTIRMALDLAVAEKETL